MRGPIAEERDLDPELDANLGTHPAGRVPPFDAKIGMAAVVARKAERNARGHARVILCQRASRHQDDGRREEAAAPHQSSFTARTTSAPIAWRPLAMAISVDNARTTSAKAASGAQGNASSMPQWND